NGHTGMIYCSNLCTEIAQNMAPIEHISTEVHTENGVHSGGDGHTPRRVRGLQPGESVSR
ncbi:hypothetical protein LEA_02467, partial [human gut metagenome]